MSANLTLQLRSPSFQVWSFQVRLELMQETPISALSGSVMHEARRLAKTLKHFTQVLQSLRLYHPIVPRRPSSTHLGPMNFCRRRMILPQHRCPKFGICGLARILPQWPGQLNHRTLASIDMRSATLVTDGRLSTPIRGHIGIRGYSNLINTTAASQEHVYVYPDHSLFGLNALPLQQDSPLNIPTAVSTGSSPILPAKQHFFISAESQNTP